MLSELTEKELTSTHVQFFCLVQGIHILGILYLYGVSLVIYSFNSFENFAALEKVISALAFRHSRKPKICSFLIFCHFLIKEDSLTSI